MEFGHDIEIAEEVFHVLFQLIPNVFHCIVCQGGSVFNCPAEDVF
jgi:hypothetical protein